MGGERGLHPAKERARRPSISQPFVRNGRRDEPRARRDPAAGCSATNSASAAGPPATSRSRQRSARLKRVVSRRASSARASRAAAIGFGSTAHQLGDELSLADSAPLTRDAAREIDRVAKLFGQVEAWLPAPRAPRSAVRPGPGRSGPGASVHPWSGGGGSPGSWRRRIAAMLACAPWTQPDIRTHPPPPDQKALEQSSNGPSRSRSGGATAAEAGVGVSAGPVGHRAARRSGNARIPARPQPRRHRLCRPAQGLGEHGEPARRRRSRRRSRKALLHRAASRPTTNLRACRMPRCMARDLPDLDLCHPWDTRCAGRRSSWRGAARPRASPWTRASRNSEGASVATHRRLRVFGNSHGFIGGYPSTSHSVSCVVLGQDGRRDAARLLVHGGARLARARGRRGSRAPRGASAPSARLGAGKLPTRKAPVLFAPELARGLIGHFVGAIGGGAPYRAAASCWTPPGSRSSRRRFRCANGRTCRARWARRPSTARASRRATATWSSTACCTATCSTAYSARKLGLRTTGNAGGVHNLLSYRARMLDPKTLLRKLGTGLLVTEMMGQGVNPVTGDYSRGAAGFWVENGERRRVRCTRSRWPATCARCTGASSRWATTWTAAARSSCGSILIDEMTIAGD